MNTILKQAYIQTEGREPDPSLVDWQLAEALVNNFRVPVLGEELAKEVIFQIINHVLVYPDRATTTRIVGKAEALASELFSGEGISDEPHMADIEHLEREAYEDKNKLK